jgi:hypothetical protein
VSDVYRLRITPGIPLTVPMTYTRSDVPTQVDALKAQIWTRRTGGALVRNISDSFSQDSPGMLVLTLDAATTTELAPYEEAELWWDAYGAVGGEPIRLIAPSPVIVLARTSDLT